MEVQFHSILTSALGKLGEHNRIQLVWVPGHMGIARNGTADQLARQGSSHALT
jgi:ribonuclease HI